MKVMLLQPSKCNLTKFRFGYKLIWISTNFMNQPKIENSDGRRERGTSFCGFEVCEQHTAALYARISSAECSAPLCRCSYAQTALLLLAADSSTGGTQPQSECVC